MFVFCGKFSEVTSTPHHAEYRGPFQTTANISLESWTRSSDRVASETTLDSSNHYSTWEGFQPTIRGLHKAARCKVPANIRLIPNRPPCWHGFCLQMNQQKSQKNSSTKDFDIPANSFVTNPPFILSSTKRDFDDPSSENAFTKRRRTDACSSFCSASWIFVDFASWNQIIT